MHHSFHSFPLLPFFQQETYLRVEKAPDLSTDLLKCSDILKPDCKARTSPCLLSLTESVLKDMELEGSGLKKQLSG